MWPWAHVASAYLLYAGFRWYLNRPAPVEASVIALVIGALLPDLVDKPLAWQLNVLPHGRSLAHSLVISAVVLGVGLLWARHVGRERLVGAFAFGYVVHLGGDALWPVVSGNYLDTLFLFWPLTNPPVAETATLIGRLTTVELTPFFVELLVTVAGIGLWWYQGSPGTGSIRRWLRSGSETPS